MTIEKSESYDEIKDTLNKLHDELYSTDDTLKKRFINNSNKEELPYNDRNIYAWIPALCCKMRPSSGIGTSRLK